MPREKKNYSLRIPQLGQPFIQVGEEKKERKKKESCLTGCHLQSEAGSWPRSSPLQKGYI